MQPNTVSIDIESSTTSAEATTDGEMLSGLSLYCFHKFLRLDLIPRVEPRPIQERTGILGSFAGGY